MKKFLSLILMFSISLSSFASTGAVQGLEKAINEYEYSLSVDWDQKDADFRQKLNNKFAAEVKDIIAKEGLGREELFGLLSKKIKSKEQLEALKLKVALLPKNLTMDQQLESLLQSLESGAQGASWNSTAGTVAVYSLVAVMVGFTLFVIANSIQMGDCVEHSTEQEYSCSSEGDCGYYYPCLKHENESWL